MVKFAAPSSSKPLLLSLISPQFLKQYHQSGRMGDPVSSKEWEIEKRPADSLPISSSKASWVFNTGLQLGRNIMIITLFASSVPIVLPPLLIISALGFAFSVPCGVIFASYTCTEKIMSKLLPLPGHPPLMLDYSEEKEVGYEEDDVAVEEEVHPLLLVSAIGEGDKNIREDDFSKETTDLLEGFRDVPEKPVTEMNETDSRGNRPETVEFGSIDAVTHKEASAADEKPETKLDRIDTHKDSVKDVNGPPEASNVSSKDVTTEEQQQEEEEKIRKQMNALREIIGYKGTNGSCVDELKALFVFTGVEPPASFKEQAPIAFVDVNDSLQFLKSVVGVK